jgi:hypothetical protein
MALKPWHTVVTPREDLREQRPLDAAEFAVHLDQVREGTAPAVYQQPREFFERTFLTNNLAALAAETARRLSGIQTETSAVFNLATQFGGGKTHALTLLYHLAARGAGRDTPWPGVDTILARAGVRNVPRSAVAVFVGTEFDSLQGRGGADGAPVRMTPWGEIAFQLGGAEGFARVAEHDRQGIAPGGDVIRKFLPTDRPCLILMDELLNYVSRFRKSGLSSQLYDFLLNLSETARGLNNTVLAVSIPSSELEMTPEDHTDYERFKKLLDRLGKPYLLSSETETSEIIRRRLFEWDTRAIGQNGRVSLPREARATCDEYARWVIEHRHQLPQWFPIDRAAEAFAATYPFHPSVISVFERKWQALPRFQRTRGVLRMLALWVAHAYSENYRRAHRDPLIGLGSAPLDDTQFRPVIFEQLGESRLEPVITTDITGRPDSHATRLDDEATEVLRKARLHRKVATSIFFESHGGAARKTYATVPEVRLAVAEPELDIGNVETALDALTAACYYLTVEGNQYRFGLSPNLNALLADRRATIQMQAIEERVRQEVEQVFKSGAGIERVYFPSRSNDIPDRAALTLAVLAPDIADDASSVQARIEAMTREYGASSRQYKNALIWCVPESVASLNEEARKLLAWESIASDDQLFTGDDADTRKRQLDESRRRAERDLQASIWRSYRRLTLLGKDNQLKTLDLGQMNGSGGAMVTQILLQLQQRDELTQTVGPAFLVRNWPPAFTEWSTRGVRDAFYASPRFPRLQRADILKDTIAKGVGEGVLAYVGKTPSGEYEPFYFRQSLSPAEVDITDEMYVITGEAATAYLAQRAAPREQDEQVPPGPLPPAEEPPDGPVFMYPPITKRREEVGDAHTGTLRWSGGMPPQKWASFYAKVLTGLVNAGELRLTVSVVATPDSGLSPQRVEAIKAALRELGLSDDIIVS